MLFRPCHPCLVSAVLEEKSFVRELTAADPFRIPTWKRRLTDHIKEAMEQSRTQQEFVAYMNAYGYDVKRSGCSSSIPPKAAACRSWKSER